MRNIFVGSHRYQAQLAMLLGVRKERAYVTNDAVRMAALNCFEEFLSLSLLLKYCNSLIGLCIGVKNIFL